MQRRLTTKAAKAPRYIRGQITRLGQRAIVQVSVFTVGGSTPTANFRMTAATPSDLETVMQRLAKSVATGKKAEATQDIKTVTQREQMHLRRTRANHYFGLTIGGAAPLSGDAEFLAGFGFSWLWDNRNVLLGAEYRVSGLGDEDSVFWDLSLAGYYPFSPTDITLYVGGGLSLSSYTTDREPDSVSMRNELRLFGGLKRHRAEFICVSGCADRANQHGFFAARHRLLRQHLHVR